MLEKHLRAKIEKIELELSKKRKECRYLRQREKEKIESRDMWKAKYYALQRPCSINSLKTGVSRAINDTKEDYRGIKRHKYGLKVVTLSIMLYVFANCSFRSVKKVLDCLNKEYGIFSSELPSKSSIENWVQKLGYSEYIHSGADLYEGDYGIIVDESMVIRKQRLMIVLGVEALKKDEKALRFGTVKLLYIAVRSSWNWQDVVELLSKVTEKMGKKPLYVISDGDGKLIKGIKDAEFQRVADVGHLMAKFLEQTYDKQEIFTAFTKAVAGVKFRDVMKDTSYLLPPKQRTIARFLNLSSIVNWAANILRVFDKLTHIEQKAFFFLKDFKDLIKELESTFEMIHKMLKIIKNKGISYENIDKCLNLGKQYTSVPLKLMDKIKTYLKETKEILPDATTIWHASSDVIESLFGKYKQIAAPNKLHGVTPFVLSLCVYTHFDEYENDMANQIKFALENVLIADLGKWKRNYLIDNQVVRRKKVLKI